MSSFQTPLTDDLLTYVREKTLREPAVLTELREVTARRPDARMQTSAEQSQLLHLLCLLVGARKVIEVGTFTGYSAAWMALALPSDGRVITCDIDDEPTAVAADYWKRAGIADRIDLRLGPAADTLAALQADGGEGQFDLAYIDADKTGYQDYFDRCLKLVRPGGLVTVDNVLWGGRVIGDDDSPDTRAIRAFNDTLLQDERIDMSLLPISDGLLVARRR